MGNNRLTLEKFRDVRFPIGTKLTMPYVVLALFIAIMAGYIVSKLVAENVQERFLNQLVESAQLTSDLMVREEAQQLETFRLLANTEGFAQGIETADSEQLREIVLPIAVNSQQEAVEILDSSGTSILSLRHRAGGNLEEYLSTKDNAVFAEWPFVQAVLNRQIDGNNDKHADVMQATWGDYFYIAGPVLDADDNLLGVVLVGKSLPTMVREFRQGTFAQITMYDAVGRPFQTTLPTEEMLAVEEVVGTAVLAEQDVATRLRDQTVGSIDYVETLIPWEVRGGTDLGILGVALPKTFLIQASRGTQLQLFLLITIALLSVITVGVLLSNRITSPLLNIVRASTEVALGNLDVTVEPVGRDEVSLLASSFNQMVDSLREGAVYRDLLGRTVTPAVREEMRRSLVSGNLRLEGQNEVATALYSDIRSFTAIAEQNSPTATFSMLNEYFGQVVPAITDDGGLVTDFAGDAILAFFGLLPRPLTAAESAYQGCCAGLKMMKIIRDLNNQRARDGRPIFVTGIGINTGEVTAGSIGSADRMHYTVIGDTVNTAQRLESFTKSLGETAIVVSQHTYEALGSRRQEFHFEPLGPQIFKGKSEQLQVYRLCD